MKTFEIKSIIKATAEVIYNAWLDGEIHGEMTGGAATCEAFVGGDFTAWDGYISGTNLELEENQRIVQAWRTTEFGDDENASLLDISFKNISEGCEITLLHKEIPAGQSDYEKGWEEHYFIPMKNFFNS